MRLASTADPRTAPRAPSRAAPPEPPPPTVMVTGAGGRVGEQVIEQLLARGMRVISTDITPLPVPRVDFVLGPYAGSPSYIPFLEATLTRFGVDLLIPTVPDELPTLAAAAPVLSSRVAVAAPGPIALCHDALLTMRYLARHRVPVPVTVTVRPAGVPRQQVGDAPYVVRPRFASSHDDAQMIEDPTQLPARNDTFVAQDLAPGEEIIAQVHRSVRDGVTTVVLVRSSGGGPMGDGHPERVERLEPGEEREIDELARVVCRALDLTGAFAVDVRRSAAGSPVVLAVDPGLGTHSHLAPELLDGLLDDAALQLPLRAVPSSGPAAQS